MPAPCSQCSLPLMLKNGPIKVHHFRLNQFLRKRPRNRLLLCDGPERLGIDVLRKQGGKLFGSPG